METPKLIENQTKNFLLESLRSCHNYRQKTYLITWNLMIFLIFVIVFGFGLYYCAQRKKMKDTIKTKTQQKDEEYIVNKIKEMREMERQIQMRMTTTQLPVPISSHMPSQIGEHPSGYAY